jgi:ubiquinone/menaquinone biosynthesis C-methylase UbiE
MLIVAIKGLLIAGVVALTGLGLGFVGAGISVAALHGIVLLAILVIAAWGGLSHAALFGGAKRHRGRTTGTVLYDAARYDLLVRLLTFGREGRFRQRLLGPAGLQIGESVLDVGCGTGSLAIAAKRQVGDRGAVIGLDASEAMIARARSKAAKARLDVTFVPGLAQALPFDESQFDVVVGTLMLHHLSKPLRPVFVKEANRVLRQSGRLVLIDFGRSAGKPKASGLHRHGHVDMASIGAVLAAGGFAVEKEGRLGVKGLEYIVGRKYA